MIMNAGNCFQFIALRFPSKLWRFFFFSNKKIVQCFFGGFYCTLQNIGLFDNIPYEFYFNILSFKFEMWYFPYQSQISTFLPGHPTPCSLACYFFPIALRNLKLHPCCIAVASSKPLLHSFSPLRKLENIIFQHDDDDDDVCNSCCYHHHHHLGSLWLLGQGECFHFNFVYYFHPHTSGMYLVCTVRL